MTEDGTYTRRRLLQAVGVTGVVGAAGGGVTGAYLSDRELFSGSIIQTGELDLELATAQASDVEGLPSFSGDDFQTAGTTPIGFPDVDPGETGVFRVGHRLGGARGWVWMRTDSSRDTALGTYLDVDLLRRPTCDGDGTLLYRGTLDDLISTYAKGALLTDNCISGEWCLDLRWEFRDGAPAELSEESFSCNFDFTAVQCRNNQEPHNPWN